MAEENISNTNGLNKKKADGNITCRITVKYTTMRVVHTIRFFSFILFPSSMVARPYATAPRRPP